MARVLVVDDDELVRFLVREVLESAGHEVITANNGAEALEVLQDSLVDVVLLDILMPTVDGVEFLIQHRANFCSVPVIAMSGGGKFVDLDYLQKVMRFLGARSFIAKPFTSSTLEHRVSELVR